MLLELKRDGKNKSVEGNVRGGPHQSIVGGGVFRLALALYERNLRIINNSMRV